MSFSSSTMRIFLADGLLMFAASAYGAGEALSSDLCPNRPGYLELPALVLFRVQQRYVDGPTAGRGVFVWRKDEPGLDGNVTSVS